MASLIYKPANRGEGKTSWLLDKAFYEHDLGKRCYLLCRPDEIEYRQFCNKYLALYSQICPVMPLELYEELDNDCVLFIDNAFSHSDIQRVLEACYPRCAKIYITLEGFYDNDYTIKE